LMVWPLGLELCLTAALQNRFLGEPRLLPNWSLRGTSLSRREGGRAHEACLGGARPARAAKSGENRPGSAPVAGADRHPICSGAGR